jgi:hypothetical protein
MFQLVKTQLGRLRIIGFVEGLSFLILLGIAMPLKYFFGLPETVRVVGMAHGLLFVLYVLLVIQNAAGLAGFGGSLRHLLGRRQVVPVTRRYNPNHHPSHDAPKSKH